MGFGFSSTFSLHLGTDTPSEREHVVQAGLWTPKKLVWLTYAFTKDGSSPRRFSLKLSPKELKKMFSSRLLNPIIFTIGTVVWGFNSVVFGGKFTYFMWLAFMVAAAFFWATLPRGSREG